MKRLLILPLIFLFSSLAFSQGLPFNTFGTSQVSCGTSATLAGIIRYRNAITIKVPTGGATVYIGGAGVTTSSGFGVDPGTAMTLQPYSGSVYCVVSTGTQTIDIAETY